MYVLLKYAHIISVYSDSDSDSELFYCMTELCARGISKYLIFPSILRYKALFLSEKLYNEKEFYENRY